MGRSQAVPGLGGGVLRAKAISGTHVAVLAWDVVEPSARKGLLGFAIRKSAAGRSWWLAAGFKLFHAGFRIGKASAVHKEDVVGSDLDQRDAVEDVAKSLQALSLSSSDAPVPTQLSTREAPIQAFSWCDDTGEPGMLYEYLVCPVYAAVDAGIEVRESAGIILPVQMEPNSSSEKHQVWFNSGVAGSQSYARRFSPSPGTPLTAEAATWLSRGLGEALLAFIDRAHEGSQLRGAVYEFTWRPVLEALVAAAARGADVRIIVDCGSSAPRVPPPPAEVSSAAASGRVDLLVPYAQKDEAKTLGAHWDVERQVWYAPNAEAELMARWPAGASGRVDLRVPYNQKDAAKKLGARWDAEKKVWYAPNAEAELLSKWPVPGPGEHRLKADIAIDEVPGLRPLILRRTRCGAIAHNKFLVLTPYAAAPSVWTGSTNFTESSVFGQANSAHVVNGDAELAKEYQEYWELLARDIPLEELKREHDRNAPDGAFPEIVDGAKFPFVRAVMSPRSSLGLIKHYGDLLASARHCVCLTAAFGVEKSLAEVLSTEGAATRYVLLEKPGPTYGRFVGTPSNRVACGALLGPHEMQGLDASSREALVEESLTGLNEHVHFVHLKFMLLDALGPAPLVISGSANFSQASVLKNDENTLFIAGDLRVADLYFVEFWRLFRHFDFRDKVAQRARGAAPPLNLQLAGDDSWLAPFYEGPHPKCRERDMLMALHVPKSDIGSGLGCAV